MPPNTGSGTILDQFEPSYKQLANPYSDTKNACFEECLETSETERTREYDAPELTVDDTVRVTTRARLTYELYDYSKNAMMIVTTRPDAYLRTGVVDLLKNTFEKFRFEVNVEIASKPSKLYEMCDTFFQRDFTEYGAVALVIVTPMGVNRRQPGLEFEKRFFKESVILENFKPGRNPTLTNKPMIYITEAMRGPPGPQNPSLSNNITNATHRDVVAFNLPGTLEKAVRRLCMENKLDPADVLEGPLKIFCDKLSARGDNENFLEIIFSSFGDFLNEFSVDIRTQLNNPNIKIRKPHIEVVNTLTKELYLARVADQ